MALKTLDEQKQQRPVFVFVEKEKRTNWKLLGLYFTAFCYGWVLGDCFIVALKWVSEKPNNRVED